MRVAFINSFYFPEEVGGAERSVRFLAESLVSAGHEVLVVCTGRERKSEVINGVNVERLPVANLYYPLDAAGRGSVAKLIWHTVDSYNPLAMSCVREVLSQFKPDVLHTNTLSGFSVGVWSLASALDIPVVHTLRDYYLLCPNTAMFKHGEQCKSRCGECRVLGVPRKFASRSVQSVIGNSDFILKRHLHEGLFPESSADVIYNAYEPEDFAQDLRDPQQITFGFIGRIAPTKGVGVLLSAFRAVPHLHDRIKLLIAGGGDREYLEELQEQAFGLPVEFVGTVTPQSFYSRLDWCVVPSLWDEPLARVLFEAFAHGVPVIGARTGGTPELVREACNGFIYEANDVSALSGLLEKASNMSESGWLEMRDNCRVDSQRFLPSQVVANYIEKYRALRK